MYAGNFFRLCATTAAKTMRHPYGFAGALVTCGASAVGVFALNYWVEWKRQAQIRRRAAIILAKIRARRYLSLPRMRLCW